MSADPYAALGLAPNADWGEVKAAYRRLVKACHPDRAGVDPLAAARFQAVTAAYEALARMRRRERLSAELFSRARVRVKAPRRGEDRRVAVRLALGEAVAGVVKVVELAPGVSAQARFPAGVETGAMLRLAGLGEPGRDGGPDGDALLHVEIEPDDRVRLQGRDAYAALVVPPRRLAAGGVVDVETLVGKVALKVPPKARPGQTLRLKGKGLPARGSRPAGDFYVTLEAAEPQDIADVAASLALRLRSRGA